jgi:putative addiction module component (TIGR02574 family)
LKARTIVDLGDELPDPPVQEKLRVIEHLWDEIAASGEEFPVPAWVRAEITGRLSEIKSQPELSLTREQVWNRVDRQRS